MDYTKELTEVLKSSPLLALIILLAVQWVVGVLAAMKDGKFEFAEMAGVLKKSLVWVGAFVSTQLAGEGMGSGTGDVVTSAGYLAFLPILKGILKNVRVLGLPLEKVVGPTVADLVAKKDDKPTVPPG